MPEYEMEGSFIHSFQFGARYSNRDARRIRQPLRRIPWPQHLHTLLPLDFEIARRGSRNQRAIWFETF